MPKRLKDSCPVHVTRWKEIWVEDGVLYATFLSGPDEHLLSMGPAKCLEAIELARRALMAGMVLPMTKKEAANH